MKKMLSLILCLCLAASLLMGLSAQAGAETPPEERDLIILFTSDVHCAVDQGWGYTGLYAVKEKLSRSENVLLVDCGDAIQGEPIGLLTGGEAIVSIMNVMGYDAAIPGNHEFDYGVEQFLALTEKANYPYLSCNFTKNGEPVLKPWLIKEIGGMKIGFVGVTTPNTIRSSFPRYFQDENGNFIYGFMEDETGEAVYGAVQKAADELRAAGADFVIVLGHLGSESGSSPWMYSDVISHCSGIDAWIDGHSHDSDQVIIKDRDGKDVVRSACGTKLNEIGVLRITREGEISSELFTWASSLPASWLLGLENAASEAVSAETDDLNRLLNDGFAVTDYTLCMNDPETAGSDGRPVRLIRRTETNLGDLCADAFLDQGGSDIAFVTGGCIRDDIPKGDISYNDILRVSPYGNNLAVIEVTGRQVLDALEWSVHALPGEFGGFSQVAGLQFEVDLSVDSPCVQDEKGFFDRVDGTMPRRVRGVTVGGQPLDPEKTYTLSSYAFTVLDQGDGYTMFDGAKVLQAGEEYDCQVIFCYLTETLGGRVGAGYENPYGEGRIVFVSPEG